MVSLTGREAGKTLVEFNCSRICSSYSCTDIARAGGFGAVLGGGGGKTTGNGGVGGGVVGTWPIMCVTAWNRGLGIHPMMPWLHAENSDSNNV